VVEQGIDKAQTLALIQPESIYVGLAKWQGSGLQNRLRWFDSNTLLQFIMADPIEEDDEKMEELLMLQSEVEDDAPPASIEEKYEEQIMMAEVTEIISRQMLRREQEEKREGKRP
jgi:hypothetical protein